NGHVSPEGGAKGPETVTRAPGLRAGPAGALCDHRRCQTQTQAAVLHGFQLDADHDAGRPVAGIVCAHEPGGDRWLRPGLMAAGRVSRDSPGGGWTGTGAAASTWPWTRSGGWAPG